MSAAAIETKVTGRDQYRALAFRRILILSGLAVALAASIAIDMALGPANYSLSQVLSALFSPETAGDQLRVVIWDIRMPIALMAVMVGASLSVAGAQMQTILSNPLASPFTLGISAAASFGAALGLKVGDMVVHESWGEGMVLDMAGAGDKTEIVIRFPGVGEKRLLLAWAPLKRA